MSAAISGLKSAALGAIVRTSAPATPSTSRREMFAKTRVGIMHAALSAPTACCSVSARKGRSRTATIAAMSMDVFERTRSTSSAPLKISKMLGGASQIVSKIRVECNGK